MRSTDLSRAMDTMRYGSGSSARACRNKSLWPSWIMSKVPNTMMRLIDCESKWQLFQYLLESGHEALHRFQILCLRGFFSGVRSLRPSRTNPLPHIYTNALRARDV